MIVVYVEVVVGRFLFGCCFLCFLFFGVVEVFDGLGLVLFVMDDISWYMLCLDVYVCVLVVENVCIYCVGFVWLNCSISLFVWLLMV